MKRLLALLLTLTMTLSLAAPAFAAEETRDTDFFTPRSHADTDFADMAYEAVDVDAALAQMEAVRALSADAANADAVLSGFQEVMETVKLTLTMDTLAYIYSCLDVNDEEADANYQAAEKAATDIADAALELLADLLHSPCADAFDEVLTEEEREWYADYTPMTQEQKDLDEQITALATQFWVLDNAEYTTEYAGEEVTDDEVYLAALQGLIDYDTYIQLSREIAKAENEAKGPLYLQLVELRERMAATYDYDNFSVYAYENNYDRDYTPEEAAAFAAAVKEYIAPLFWDLYDLYRAESYRAVFSESYTGEVALDIVSSYLPLLSDELVESFTYMVDHGLYDIEYSETKSQQGYTTALYSYAAPFFFNSPSGNVQDLTTAIHEFGHYNNFYWTDPGLMLDGKNTDLAEVHSQALELLFTHFYPDLFGEEDGEAVELMIVYSMLYSIVQGALQDQLQQYVYATEDVTLSQINAKYRQLCEEYGYVSAEDERTEMYDWVKIPHTFETPMYYISYATSAAGAFSFWLDAQQDYFKGVDDYLKFTALTTDYGFQESFEALGMDSPLSATYLAELAEALREHLNVDERLANLPVVGYFKDVALTDWFVEGVSFVYNYDLMDWEDPATFDPKGAMTRGDWVETLYRWEEEPEVESTVTFADVEEDSWYADAVAWAVSEGVANGYGGNESGSFGVEDTLTREQLITILYRYAQYCGMDVSVGEDTNILSYDDALDVAQWAIPSMQWACGAGIVEGTGTGSTLSPKATISRAEAATLLYRFLLALYAEE